MHFNFQIKNVNIFDRGEYRCILKNAAGELHSDKCILKVCFFSFIFFFSIILLDFLIVYFFLCKNCLLFGNSMKFSTLISTGIWFQHSSLKPNMLLFWRQVSFP